MARQVFKKTKKAYRSLVPHNYDKMALILFCLFSFLCIWTLFRNFNFLSSYNILLGSFYLYYCLAFLGYFTGGGALRYIDAQVAARYRKDQLVLEFILLNLFVIGMLLARLIIKTKLTINDHKGIALPPPSYKNILVTSYTLMTVGLILYALFIHVAYGSLYGMLHINRYELYQRKKGTGSLLIGLYIFYAGAIIRLFYYVLYRKTVQQKIPIAVIIIATLLLIVQYKNSDRSSMLFFMLPLCLLLLCKKPKFNFYMALFLPFILIATQLISIQRKLKQANSNQDVFSYVMQNRQSLSLLQNGEFHAPSLVDKKVCENINTVPIRYGGTYIDALLNLPPSWMVSKRPMLAAEWYASTFFPNEYRRGQGYGFSVIAESVLNFYYAGPVIYGLLLGLLLLYIDKKLKGASFYYFTVFCMLQYYVFLIPRSGIAGLLKPVMAISCLVILCISATSYFFRPAIIKP